MILFLPPSEVLFFWGPGHRQGRVVLRIHTWGFGAQQETDGSLRGCKLGEFNERTICKGAGGA